MGLIIISPSSIFMIIKYESDPMNISGVCAEEAFYKSDMIYDIFINGYIFPLNEYSISIYNI